MTFTHQKEQKSPLDVLKRMHIRGYMSAANPFNNLMSQYVTGLLQTDPKEHYRPYNEFLSQAFERQVGCEERDIHKVSTALLKAGGFSLCDVNDAERNPGWPGGLCIPPGFQREKNSDSSLGRCFLETTQPDGSRLRVELPDKIPGTNHELATNPVASAEYIWNKCLSG